MNDKENTSDVLKNAMDEMFDQLDKANVSTLEHLAQLQENRAARLAAVEARLKVNLGDDHRGVVALRRAADLADASKLVLRTTATREARRPKIGPHEWMVFGEVRDPNGEPVSRARVRVFDRDRKYDDLLGETETDEHGDFAVVYHERDFAEAREQLPELYVMVQDAQGRLLYSSEDSVRHNPGRAEYFEIVLGEKPVSKKDRPRTRKKASGPEAASSKQRPRRRSSA